MKKRTPIKISRQTHWKIVLLLVLAIVVLAIVSQVVAVRPWTGGRQAERGARSGGLPETDPEILACPFFANDEFVVRCPEGRYTMLYDTAYRQAAWVAYLLTRRDVSGKGVKRSGVFKSDPEVIARGWPSAADRDYTGSGFDRGHLLPSADRNDTPQENGATFRLSNVSPQRPGLNRGTWRRLEERVRRWAARYDSLYIVTGGELTPSLRRIRGGVGIPQRFFKTILVRDFPGDRFPDPEYGASGRGLFSLCDQRRQSRTGARHGFLFSAARQRRNARRGLLRPFFLALVPRPTGRFAVPSGRFAAPIRNRSAPLELFLRNRIPVNIKF